MREDWLQVNWELLIEGSLNEQGVVLETYGGGADCNGTSSRVLYPDRHPTHKIICKPMNNEQIYDALNKCHLDISKSEIVFDSFVCIGEDGWYYERPPFDKVLAEYAGEYVVVDFKKTDFHLRQAKQS